MQGRLTILELVQTQHWGGNNKVVVNIQAEAMASKRNNQDHKCQDTDQVQLHLPLWEALDMDSKLLLLVVTSLPKLAIQHKALLPHSMAVWPVLPRVWEIWPWAVSSST